MHKNKRKQKRDSYKKWRKKYELKQFEAILKGIPYVS